MRRRTKQIMLVGWYGMANTGDDALVAVSAWGGRHYLGAARFTATAATIPTFVGSENVFPALVSHVRFQGENRLRLYREALRSHSIVFGGGSVFHSSSDMKKANHLLRMAGKGPHAALGVGIGPFRDAGAEKVCATLLNRLAFVGLRDSASLQIARAIAPGVHSEKTFDLAPLLPRSAGLSVEEAGTSVRRNGIGFALCDYEHFVNGNANREAIRREKLVRMFDHLDPAEVGEIVFLDFNGHRIFGDAALHRDIAARISNRFRVRHVAYSAAPLHVLKEVAALRAIVAMRLHAAVFGFMARTPTIMLAYHQKCLAWASDVGLAAAQIFDSVEFDEDSLADAISRGIRGELASPTLCAKDAEQSALRNWELAGAIS